MDTRARAEEMFRLVKIGGPAPGVMRDAYGSGETRAIRALQVSANISELRSYQDPAGNLVIELEGTEPDLPIVATGSHMDSVPHGGNYDGAAGVIAGLLALMRLREEEWQGKRTVRVYGFRGEESAWFGKCYLGSTALLHGLTGADLALMHRDGTGSLLIKAYAQGINLTLARDPIVPPEQLRCFLELHIEQGPVLLERDLPLAAVSAIRGNFRFPFAMARGRAAHSGTTPMEMRDDAVMRFSRFGSRLDGYLRAPDSDVVYTIGIVETNRYHHAISRVADEVTFSLEVRSISAAVMYEMVTRFTATATEMGIDLGESSIVPPAELDVELTSLLGEAWAWSVPGYELPVIPSGAGHDAAVFAKAGVPTAMLFVRNQNGSHNPDEAMDMDDFMVGVDVLQEALVRLAEE